MTTTLTVQEGASDLAFLSKNHYNLQVAKAVSAPGGKPMFNVVYKSTSLAPNMEVSWTPEYGLNWTTQMADPGAKVIYTGNWQACKLGESYNLTNVGEWVINNKDPNKDANSVNVGSNGYPQAVNIVVGIWNQDTQSWQASYPTLMPQNHLPLSPGSSWDSAITITSSPSSVSSCDDIDDDEWNMFGDTDDGPLKSSFENSDKDLGIATTSTVQPMAGQEVLERAPVPTPWTATAFMLSFLSMTSLSIARRHRVNAMAHQLRNPAIKLSHAPL
ncbi:hypothetical protein MAC_05239 [Metarhizium acridum CQMa 102]|uniref:Uncharacterized protein n=1 Tax=Metarhizium acridum (strain CQMa 102) TaxID=655827 RepID=E9E5U1_METAQ|nr:uncharacterized protein MAC_05239 [Metarhizium acridum CQMa 102]EFY88804.1 hypothetical protein MAC_05239 [Metarhizium acridum CQMa 102]